MRKFLALFLTALIALPPITAIASTGCNYPTSLDTFSNFVTGDSLTPTALNTRSCAIEKLESGPLRPNKGSAGAPSYAFINDDNTGVTSLADNQLDLVTAGVSRLSISSVGTVSTSAAFQVGTTAQTGTTNRFRMLQTMARAQTAVAQTILNNTETALLLGSESTDTDTIHSTASNQSRLTAQIAGKYLVTGAVDWASNATGVRRLRVKKNGTTDYAVVNVAAVNGSTTNLTISAFVDLAATDYIEMVIFQDSGVSIDAQGGSLAMVYVGE